MTTDAKTMQAALKAEIIPGKRLETTLDAVVRAASRRELDYRLYHAAMGMAYAITTCRVGGMLEARLRALTPPKLFATLARIATETEALGFVPAWLNANA